MNSLTLLVALSAVLTACEGAEIRGLMIRQASGGAGGFATRAPTCSTNQVDCGGGITYEICCPAGTTCFNSDDGVCCPTDVDCTTQVFAAPSCADSSMYLCTDYQPNIPSYVPNDPGYWCCPVGTQCVVSSEAGFVCRAPISGDVPGSTVLSGQAPTQASTATTAPTLGPTSGAGKTSSAGPLSTGSSNAGASGAGSPNSGPSNAGPSTATTSPAKSSSAIRTSSFLSVPTSLGLFVAQALFAVSVAVLL